MTKIINIKNINGMEKSTSKDNSKAKKQQNPLFCLVTFSSACELASSKSYKINSYTPHPQPPKKNEKEI